MSHRLSFSLLTNFKLCVAQLANEKTLVPVESSFHETQQNIYFIQINKKCCCASLIGGFPTAQSTSSTLLKLWPKYLFV